MTAMAATSGITDREYVRRFAKAAREIAEDMSRGKRIGPPLGVPRRVTRRAFVLRYVEVAKRIAEANAKKAKKGPDRDRLLRRSLALLGRIGVHHLGPGLPTFGNVLPVW